jgi:S-DNA-T family DNA segregation ATPase FtsK/SpoIIIE
MSFPLGSLGAATGAALESSLPTSPVARFRLQVLLVAGALAWLLTLLAFVTHSPLDAAWSSSGIGDGNVRNLAGVLGAWFSDIAFFLFGRSAWWGPLIGGIAWLAALARLLRTAQAPAAALGTSRPRWLFWLGVVLLFSRAARPVVCSARPSAASACARWASPAPA